MQANYDVAVDQSPATPGLRRSVLAICGGGNAGHALAVVASQNFSGDLVWLVGSEEKAELLRRGVFSNAGLHSTGVITASAKRVRSISADPAAIIPAADIVMIVVPAFAHSAILKKIGPHLKEGALVGTLPTRGGFEFEATQIMSQSELGAERLIFGLQTLPWSTRVVEPGTIVNFGACKATVLAATMPSRRAEEVTAELSTILGTQIVPTTSFLNMTLGNPGQVIHPGLMYGLFSQWSGEGYREDAVPYFYRDVSDQTGGFVGKLSDEIVTLAKTIEWRSGGTLDLSGVLPIHKWLRISYPTQTADVRSVATCFRTGPLQARRAPMIESGAGNFVPNFRYRYLSEDVPFGLAVVKAIAQLAGVPTPHVDSVVMWTQDKLGKRYLENGKFDGPDAHELPIPQNFSITSLSDLIDWYAR